MSKRLVDAKWQNDIVEDDDYEDDEDDDDEDDEDDDDEDDDDDNFSAAGSEKRPLAQPPQQHAPWDLDLNLHNIIIIIIIITIVNTTDNFDNSQKKSNLFKKTSIKVEQTKKPFRGISVFLVIEPSHSGDWIVKQRS